MEKDFEKKRFMKIFGIYLVVLFAFVAVRLGAAYGLFSKIENEIAVDAISTAIIQIGIMFLIPLVLYIVFFRRSAKKTFSDFGFKRIGIKAVLVCVLIGILGFIINLYASTFFSIILSRLGYSFSGGAGGYEYDSIPKFLFGVLSVAILPGICEEFAHRGLLLQGTRKVWGYKTAIIISSIFFGLMHLNIQQFFFATVLGILMASTDISAKSIYPSIIMHFMNNFINVFLSFGQSKGFIKFSISSLLTAIYDTNIILFLLFVTVILFGCLVAFIYLIKLLHKISLQNQKEQAHECELKTENATSDQVVLNNEINVITEEKQEKKRNPKTVNEWIEKYIAPSDSKKLNVSFVEKIPFILCLFMATLITVFTFIWGVV